MAQRIAIAGGGAAGVFAAIAAAEQNATAEIVVFEATADPLDKVRISGGGRCNVTHHCFDPAVLITNYPRGGRELLGPFTRFQPGDTIEWFRQHGVALKTESDGRVFPTTDSSSTIVNCLLSAARESGVQLRLNSRVKQIERGADTDRFAVTVTHNRSELFDSVLVATGNSVHGHQFAERLGHTIVPCVPSLFTFKISDPRLAGLTGISFERVETALRTSEVELKQTGPMLITHWGLSGPAILKLSAWGARPLHDSRYRADLRINFLPDLSRVEFDQMLLETRTKHGKQYVQSHSPFGLPRRYWAALVGHAGIPADVTWSSLTRDQQSALKSECTAAEFEIRGKGMFKEEFVTCGGVALDEIDFRTMQSRKCPGLYFAGEVLDIDAVTGGFNFQAAWTTGWIAGRAMAG